MLMQLTGKNVSIVQSIATRFLLGRLAVIMENYRR